MLPLCIFISGESNTENLRCEERKNIAINLAFGLYVTQAANVMLVNEREAGSLMRSVTLLLASCLIGLDELFMVDTHSGSITSNWINFPISNFLDTHDYVTSPARHTIRSNIHERFRCHFLVRCWKVEEQENFSHQHYNEFPFRLILRRRTKHISLNDCSAHNTVFI